MFYLDSRHVYRVTELDSIDWLEHGFGTILADIPARFPRLATLKQVHSAACVAAEGRAGAHAQVGWADPETGISFAYLNNAMTADLMRSGMRASRLATIAAALA